MGGGKRNWPEGGKKRKGDKLAHEGHSEPNGRGGKFKGGEGNGGWIEEKQILPVERALENKKKE